MKKTKTSMGRASLLLLAVVLVAIPLLGVACSDEDGFKAQFTASPQSGDSPLTVTFTDQSEGDIIGWEWDFDGDGEVDSTEQNPTHTYYTPDQWTVSLLVTNADQEIHKEIKENYINTTGVVYETMELIMTNPYPETDITGKVAAKFEELIEMYTGGNVSVTVHYNSTLLQHIEQFEGLQAGGTDIAVNHGRFVKYINTNLAPVDSMRGLVLDFRHGQAIVADPAVNQYLVDEYGEYGIRFLGYVDSIVIAGYMSNVDMEDYVDFDGVKYGNWGAELDPWENMFGAIGVLVTQADVATKVAMGQVDALGFPTTMAYTTGMYAMFSSFTLVEIYTPYMILMSEAIWDNMSPELQELISDTIMPEVQAYAAEEVIEDHKIAVKGLKDNMANVYYIPTERNQEAWEMLQDQPDFQALKATVDPELIALIEAHRPADVTIAPEVDEILTYAGVPH